MDGEEDLGEVHGLQADTARLEDLLRAADGVEGRRPGADGADRRTPKAADDAGDGGELLQLGEELVAPRVNRVAVGEGVADAVLGETVARGHLSAEAVAPVHQAHLALLIREGVDQHGNVELADAHGLRHGALVAEVGKGDQDALDLISVLPEEPAALLSLLPGLHGAELGVARAQAHYLDAGLLEDLQHLLAARFHKMIGEEAPVADHKP